MKADRLSFKQFFLEKIIITIFFEKIKLQQSICFEYFQSFPPVAKKIRTCLDAHKSENNWQKVSIFERTLCRKPLLMKSAKNYQLHFDNEEREREREKNVERKKIRTFRLIARDLCDFKMKSMEKKFCPDKTGNFNRPRQRFIFLFFLLVLQNTPGVSGIY